MWGNSVLVCVNSLSSNSSSLIDFLITLEERENMRILVCLPLVFQLTSWIWSEKNIKRIIPQAMLLINYKWLLYSSWSGWCFEFFFYNFFCSEFSQKDMFAKLQIWTISKHLNKRQHSISKAVRVRINLIQIVFICKILNITSKFLSHKQ